MIQLFRALLLQLLGVKICRILLLRHLLLIDITYETFKWRDILIIVFFSLISFFSFFLAWIARLGNWWSKHSLKVLLVPRNELLLHRVISGQLLLNYRWLLFIWFLRSLTFLFLSNFQSWVGPCRRLIFFLLNEDVGEHLDTFLHLNYFVLLFSLALGAMVAAQAACQAHQLVVFAFESENLLFQIMILLQ